MATVTVPDAPAPPGLPLVIETKLWPPLVREGALPRSELVEALQRAIETHAVTLLSAGAGFGKTSLLAAWCASRPVPETVACVRLDAADNDPARFWAHIAESLRRTYGNRLAPASEPASPSSGAKISALLNELASIRAPRLLVLDDLHLVTNLECADGLDAFITAMPPKTRVLISSRVDPPISLARLRAGGQLAELRADRLAYSYAEARELAARTPRARVGSRTAERLRRRTEGWPAGMYLALLAAAEHEDVKEFVDRLAGDSHTIADFLVAEVLERLDPATRTFLVQTAPLEELFGPLCDATLERTGSAERLRELADANLFLVPLDDRRERFRYHPLFRDVLQLEFRRLDADTRKAVHRRAGAWYETVGGRPALAIEQAVAAEDWSHAARLVAETAFDALRKGRWLTVLGWLSALPEDELVARPLLPAMAGALAGALGRPWSEVEEWLALADRARDRRPDEWTPTAESYAAFTRSLYVRSDIGAAVLAAQHFVELSRVAGLRNEAIAHGALAWARYLAGDHAGAAEEADAALASEDVDAWAAGSRQANTVLSLVASDAGDSERALQLAKQALAAADSLDTSRPTIAASRAHLASALALAGSGRLGEAEAEVELALEQTADGPPDSAFGAYALIALASIRRRRGRLARARETLDRAGRELRRFRDPAWLKTALEEEERKLAEAQTGNTATEELTEAELGVLRQLATNGSQRQIAAALFISENTVKTHCRSIYRKLRVRSRTDALARAYDLGLLRTESPG